MLGCEEKNLEECHLLPISFPTRPAIFTHSNSKYSSSTKITDNDKDILITKATFTQRQQHSQIVVASIAYDLLGTSLVPPDSFDGV